MVLTAGFLSIPSVGQPPAGPRNDRQIDEARVTYYVSVDGDDARDGRSRSAAFATLQKAADVVAPGETVLVTRGKYRQTMHIKKEGRAGAWIRFVAEPGVTILGSDERKDWRREPGGRPIYSIPVPKLHGAYQKPGTPLQSRTEQVFVDGKLLYQAAEPNMLKPRGIFYVDDAAGKLLVCLEGGRDPNQARTEVSVRTFAIAIGGPPNMNWWRTERIGLENKAAYIQIDGFAVRHIANFSRMSAIEIRGLCHHIVIENCDVQWVNHHGIGASSMSMWDPAQQAWFHQPCHHVTLRNNIASNNGVQGIGCGAVSDLLIESNLIDNNNYKGVSPWAEGGAVKTGFEGARIILRNNVARNNDNHGLWIDYGSTDSIIENNFVFNSMAGGVLNEVTPAPPWVYEGDKRYHAELTAGEVRKLNQRGTIIRNNVIVGTRPPGGGGINISGANRSQISNNILYGNSGGGLNYGGSPDRPGILGLYGNQAGRNLFDQNGHHATTLKDGDDLKGRQFDNRFESNVFARARAAAPFRISNAPAERAAWEALDQTRGELFVSSPLFRDPEHFDFTVIDEALCRQTGFDTAALRLDWSEFFVAEHRPDQRPVREYVPLDLTDLFNHGLTGSLALLPQGRQSFDGVDYQMGSRQRGAIRLDRKPGAIPIGAPFAELVFLYGATQVPEEEVEVARFIIEYQDQTTAELRLIAGRHVLDLHADPSWRQFARLNDHGTYLAWQGPGSQGERAMVYYQRWVNPEPEKPIALVRAVQPAVNPPASFDLLALSGGRVPRQGASPQVFFLGFDGHVDALGSDGREIEAQGINRYAFAAGSFVDGVEGQGFVPKSPIHYPVPADFPTSGQGTISVWLNPEDWTTAERVRLHERADYTRTMLPFSASGSSVRHSVWNIAFEVNKADLRTLTLRWNLSGASQSFDVTELIRPSQWFHLAATWRPQPDKAGHTGITYYLNGKPLGAQLVPGSLDQVGKLIYVGVPSNGGQPWRGAIDDLLIEKIHRPADHLSAAAAARNSQKAD